jgi:hypothetical protein
MDMNMTAETKDNLQFIGMVAVFMIFIVVLIIVVSTFKKEGFLSGGTISQLFSKDSQDLMLNDSSILPYTSGDFHLEFNQPTQANHPQRGAQTASVGTKYYLDSYTGEYHPIV